MVRLTGAALGGRLSSIQKRKRKLPAPAADGLKKTTQQVVPGRRGERARDGGTGALKSSTYGVLVERERGIAGQTWFSSSPRTTRG